ncbi:holin family protein [Vibrio parahaemolyticus]|uniref:holin family protein n=1 Tax=Vibrio parahaemolyticus TaxID=670 RepID=UPI00215EBDEF|nr:holin family protein [Vibrio parahaemolyticus]MCS0077883.1 holin family protein [Vibrio parahaemolyticus]
MWDKVKSLIGNAAPLVGTLLGGPAGGAVGGLVANALGVENSPEAIETALLSGQEAMAKIKELELTHKQRLEEIALEYARLESEERRLEIATQTAVTQAEYASNDPFVRRWRPTWGYTLCFSWALMFLGLFAVMVIEPKETANVINAIVALTPLISVALAVLGINIHKRSLDKQVAAGNAPIGMFAGVKQAVKGG